MTKTPVTTMITRGAVAKPARRVRTPKATAAAKTPTPRAELKPKTHPTLEPKAPSKIDQVVALLKREGGATSQVQMEATGWQAHSVRGVIAGAIKKKLGLTVLSEAGEGGRIYRIATATATVETAETAA